MEDQEKDLNQTKTKPAKVIQFYTKEQNDEILNTKGDRSKLKTVASSQKRTNKAVYQKYWSLVNNPEGGSREVKSNVNTTFVPVIPSAEAQKMIEKASLREFRQSPAHPVQINGLMVRFPNNEFTIGDVKITW